MRQSLLLAVNEVIAAILLPAGLVALGAERLFLAIADDLDLAGCNAGFDQSVAGGVGTIIAKRKVVVGGTAFVAVSLDGEADRRMRLEECSISVDNGLIIRAQVVAIVVEVDVLYGLRKQSVFALLWRGVAAVGEAEAERR